MIVTSPSTPAYQSLVAPPNSVKLNLRQYCRATHQTDTHVSGKNR